jgi:hypothetical protein
VLVAVSYVAFLIALWGMLSLLLDRDAITEADAGPLLGPAMAVSASGVVAVALWGLARRRHPVSTAVGTTAVAYLVMLVVGTVAYWFAHPDPMLFLLFPARYALSPFVIGAALLGGLAVVFLWVVTVRDRRT